jgi:dimeric dUTPase (all-alpha-NTP-PPase superfamily)
MPQDNLLTMIHMQHQLQSEKMKDGDPAALEGDERATFLVWNAFALDDELHEAFNEIGWKPWATSRHINADAALKEMVDAWHFFMNVLIVIAGEKGWSDAQLADEFTRRYIEKNAVNAQRQDEGYDGVTGKCPSCKRDLKEVPQPHWVALGREFCHRQCASDFEAKVAAQ